MKTHVFGNLFYFIRFAIMFHIRTGSLPLGDKDEEKYKNVLLAVRLAQVPHTPYIMSDSFDNV